MSIIHVTGSGTGKGISSISDRTPFYGGKLPSQIKTIVKSLKNMDKKMFRSVLQMVVYALEGKDPDYEQIKSLLSNEMTEEQFHIIFMGIYKLLEQAVRLPKQSLKLQFFKEDLAELDIPESFHEDLASAVFGSRRSYIDSYNSSEKPNLPKLKELRWRVDVAISTSVLNRVLEPSIMMEMTSNDDKLHSFEVPVSKFHELRYSVSNVLKEMEDLEKRSILKIQD